VRRVLASGLSLAVWVGAQTPQNPAPSPKVNAKDLFEGVCSGCHTLQRVREQQRTKEEWRATTRAMIDQGAVLTPEETEMLLDYLAANFGPEKAP
jgi:mono/diheme cytochrome c family protein